MAGGMNIQATPRIDNKPSNVQSSKMSNKTPVHLYNQELIILGEKVS